MNANATAGQRRDDGWRVRRIWIAGAFGAWLGGSHWVLDFWPLAAGGQTIRPWIDLSRPLLFILLPAPIVFLSIAAGIALWQRNVRRAASSIVAITALPVYFLVVFNVPLFDPWLWYAMANKPRFEALAASGSARQPKYTVLEVEDVSTGLAGATSHFVVLIYDESDAVGLEQSRRSNVWQTRTIPVFGSPIPKGSRLYDHIFRVDYFE